MHELTKRFPHRTFYRSNPDEARALSRHCLLHGNQLTGTCPLRGHGAQREGVGVREQVYCGRAYGHTAKLKDTVLQEQVHVHSSADGARALHSCCKY